MCAAPPLSRVCPPRLGCPPTSYGRLVLDLRTPGALRAGRVSNFPALGGGAASCYARPPFCFFEKSGRYCAHGAPFVGEVAPVPALPAPALTDDGGHMGWVLCGLCSFCDCLSKDFYTGLPLVRPRPAQVPLVHLRLRPPCPRLPPLARLKSRSEFRGDGGRQTPCVFAPRGGGQRERERPTKSTPPQGFSPKK